MTVILQRILLLSLCIFAVVECALDKTEFIHDRKRYTMLGAPKSTRSKRETTAANNATFNECFQYTALGGLANETNFDGGAEAACEKLDKTTPCFLPYVFTEDGSLPDPNAVADYCEKAGCKVTCAKSSHTCISYSHIINGVTSNITYFCGDVQDTTDDVVLKYGQVTDTLPGGIVREVYFCQTPRCNSSSSKTLSILAFAIPFLLIFFK